MFLCATLLVNVGKSFGMKGARPYFCTPKKGGVDLVAQLVEHNTFNVGVLGSSPSGITENPPVYRGILYFHLPVCSVAYPALPYTVSLFHVAFLY